MSASWEMQLLSAIVRDEDPHARFKEARDFQITFHSFLTLEGRSLWAQIELYHDRPENYGHIPSEEALKETDPGLELPTPVENFYDLCKHVRSNYLSRQMSKLLESYLDKAELGQVEEAMSELRLEIGRLEGTAADKQDVRARDVMLVETIEYLRREDVPGGNQGLPWPWPQLNEITRGIHPGDYVMLWALPKNMKTWCGLYIAMHLLMTGRRVLIYSREMMWDKLRLRASAILSKLDYDLLKQPQLLSTPDEMRLLDAVETLTEKSFRGELFFTTLEKSDGTPGGADEVREKVERYAPDFIFLDSSYMLRPADPRQSSLDWRGIATINQNLKQIAKKTKIPVLSILQENERQALKYGRKSRGTASLSFYSGSVMDCDLGIRLVYNKPRKEISLCFAAARETEYDGFTIHAHAAHNFGYAHDHLWSPEEIYGQDREGPRSLPPGLLLPGYLQAETSASPGDASSTTDLPLSIENYRRTGTLRLIDQALQEQRELMASRNGRQAPVDTSFELDDEE